VPELATRPTAVGTREGAPGGAAIASVGMAVPARRVGNEPIARRLGVDEKWIVARTGVIERRAAAPGELLYSYAAEAGAEALRRAELDPGEVDLVLVATMTHEQLTPSAAALTAAEIGAERAGAIDVGAACTGFVSALALAAAQVETGRVRCALVIGADLGTRLIDPHDRSTAALFGDGAGAVVVTPSADGGRIGPVDLGADGRHADLVRAGREDGIIRMQGHDTFKHAVDRLSESTRAALAASGDSQDDIDLFVYHQANSRIIRAVGERLGLPPVRVVDSVPRYGNTSAASIPIALAEAEAEGRLAAGHKVLLAGFGGGLTWGAAVVTWGDGTEGGRDGA
jgi:3-oxoacyl-[acyl-carrier-protein] synthase III